MLIKLKFWDIRTREDCENYGWPADFRCIYGKNYEELRQEMEPHEWGIYAAIYVYAWDHPEYDFPGNRLILCRLESQSDYEEAVRMHEEMSEYAQQRKFGGLKLNQIVYNLVGYFIHEKYGL